MSTTFKDRHENTWDILITVGTINRVDNVLEINLLDIGSKGFLESVFDNPLKLTALIYECVVDQVEKKGMTPEEFADCFTGNVLDEAVDSFREALLLFFPKSKAELTKGLLSKMKEVDAETVKQQLEKMESLDVSSLVSGLLKEHTPPAKSEN